MNLFATVLTYPAPAANYRGESELNRTVIQKVTDGRFDYPIISPESMRNAIRETLKRYDLPCNRVRIHPVSGKGKSEETGEGDKQQLAVKYSQYPDPEKYVDDFFFGYLLAVKSKELDKLRKEKGDKFPLKRDSVLRMNLAKSLEPYRQDAVFTQSPQFAEGNPWKPGGGDAKASSALLHRETVVSAFQYPFALNLDDCKAIPEGRKWTRSLLKAIGELNNVAGNHARSYFEMAPASVVARLTKSLVAGYATYGFRPHKASHGEYTFPEVIDGILHDPPDYPGNEFFLGGKIVKDMEAETAKELQDRGVTLERDPRRLLEIIADKTLKG
jgi:CRISPR-associated protein Cst2